MAKRIFSQIKGAEYSTEYIKQSFGADRVKYTCTSTGDTLYMIDTENNFEIVNVIVKRIEHWYRGSTYFLYCLEKDAEKFKNYVYNQYESIQNLGGKFQEGLFVGRGKSNRTHNGLFFTTIEEAKEYQAKMIAGKTFNQLKIGDTVYAVLGMQSDAVELKISKKSTSKGDYDKHDYLYLYFAGGGHIKLDYLRYEDKANDLLEKTFYTSDLKNYKKWTDGNAHFFINKEDAEKLVSDRQKRQKKNATEKYIKQMENYDGKPIKHHDSAGKELHYGDKVAYAVARDSSSPFVSVGKIIGETEQKITIEDISGKNDYHTEKKRNVTPYSTLLLEEVSVNVNSGYSFIKK